MTTKAFSTSQLVDTLTADTQGTLVISGTTPRITGDFSNATIANRVAFQTSTVNGLTDLVLLPNGTNINSFFEAYNANTPTNAAMLQVGCNASNSFIASAIQGSGTYLPMTFYTGGSERMRIDTSGNVGIGTTTTTGLLNVNGRIATLNGTGAAPSITSTNESNAGVFFGDDAVKSYVSLSGGGAEIFRVGGANSNAVVVGPGGLGYGTGSGGTVTQATSKSTTVTLNKTNGQIVMNNAALAANTTVRFTLNNSTIAGTDCLILTLTGLISATASYQCWVDGTNTGLAAICVRNISAGTLSEAITISFAVIKAVNI